MASVPPPGILGFQSPPCNWFSLRTWLYISSSPVFETAFTSIQLVLWKLRVCLDFLCSVFCYIVGSGHVQAYFTSLHCPPKECGMKLQFSEPSWDTLFSEFFFNCWQFYNYQASWTRLDQCKLSLEINLLHININCTRLTWFPRS